MNNVTFVLHTVLKKAKQSAAKAKLEERLQQSFPSAESVTADVEVGDFHDCWLMLHLGCKKISKCRVTYVHLTTPYLNVTANNIVSAASNWTIKGKKLGKPWYIDIQDKDMLTQIRIVKNIINVFDDGFDLLHRVCVVNIWDEEVKEQGQCHFESILKLVLIWERCHLTAISPALSRDGQDGMSGWTG